MKNELRNLFTLITSKKKKVNCKKENVSLRWTLTESDLCELVIVLHESKCLRKENNKEASIIDIANVLEESFHKNINNLYQTESNIKRGKKTDKKLLINKFYQIINECRGNF